ncbi:DUF296 domain-containing protein [Myxococcota bacterium]|nr:DUF296 domain-containing protein [Myxococcota bacterium]MBU1381913.1 DUF296 domain-containing protein [Myxococcota bacterium]MBU1497814.1 DUF296 domain-containing protein [Myxococcota bacterium]
MNFVETKKQRRFVGEFTRGMEIQKAVSRLLKDNNIRTGRIKIFGHLENIILSTDSGNKAMSTRRIISGACQLISCEGIITELGGQFDPLLYSTVAVEGETGLAVYGGVLVEARVIQCDFILDSFDDLFIRRTIDASSNSAIWNEVFAETSSDIDNSELPGKMEALKVEHIEPEVEDDDDDDETNDLPAPGDILNHFKFGKCIVQKLDLGADIIQIKLPSDRTARLGIQYLTFSLVDEHEDGAREFDVKGKRS